MTAAQPATTASGGTRATIRSAAAATATTTASGDVSAAVATGVISAAARIPTTVALTPTSAEATPGRPRSQPSTGTAASTSRAPGRKIATVATSGARDPARTHGGHGAQVAREREQRPRQRLGRPVAREELVLGHPARPHDARVEERQHDVAAAEHERAGTDERGDQAEIGTTGDRGEHLAADDDDEERRGKRGGLATTARAIARRGAEGQGAAGSANVSSPAGSVAPPRNRRPSTAPAAITESWAIGAGRISRITVAAAASSERAAGPAPAGAAS